MNGMYRKPLNGSRILVAGIAYKKNITDVRESPAFDIIDGLTRRGAKVSYTDPYAPEVNEHGVQLKGVDPGVSFAEYDCVVIVTDHDAVDYGMIAKEADLVVDTRNAMAGITRRDNIVKA